MSIGGSKDKTTARVNNFVSYREHSGAVLEYWMPALRHTSEVQTSLARIRISEATHILQDDEGGIKAADRLRSTRRNTIGRQQEAPEAVVSCREEKRIHAELQQDPAA